MKFSVARVQLVGVVSRIMPFACSLFAAAACVAVASAHSQRTIAAAPPTPIFGVRYFAGWYSCAGRTNCWSHFKGYTPLGASVDDFFPYYPTRLPLLGNLSDRLSTIVAEVHAADASLDFFAMLYYGGDADCGSNPDPNLRYCLDAPLAYMLNTSEVWAGTQRLRFFVTYSNDIDRGRAGEFVGAAGRDAWLSLVGTWVRAMAHPRYLRINGRPVFEILIPDIFNAQCGGNVTLENELLGVFRAAGVAAGVGEVLIGGGWQNPSVPAAGNDPAPRPHASGYMLYSSTDIVCHAQAAGQLRDSSPPCDVGRLSNATVAQCELACNATSACVAFIALPNSTCVLKNINGPGSQGPGDAYVRVLGSASFDFTATYNAAPPVCPGEPNWVCPRYANSWLPNATAEGAKVFPYEECASFQAQARGNHSHDAVPYIPNSAWRLQCREVDSCGWVVAPEWMCLCVVCDGTFVISSFVLLLPTATFPTQLLLASTPVPGRRRRHHSLPPRRRSGKRPCVKYTILSATPPIASLAFLTHPRPPAFIQQFLRTPGTS